MSTLLGTVSDLLSHLVSGQTRVATPVVPMIETPTGLRIPVGTDEGYTIVSDPGLQSSSFQKTYAYGVPLAADLDLIAESAAQGVPGAVCRSIHFTGADANVVIVPERLGDVDTLNNVTAPVATDLATSITRLVSIATAYAAHCILVTGQVHKAADATNAITANVPTIPPEGATPEQIAEALAAAILYANDLRTNYEAHRVYLTSHGVADTVATVTAPVASDEATLVALTNDLASKFTMHKVMRNSVHAFNDVILYGIRGTTLYVRARAIRATGTAAQYFTVLW